MVLHIWSNWWLLVDTDTGRAINCWQILVTSFNGIKTYV